MNNDNKNCCCKEKSEHIKEKCSEEKHGHMKEDCECHCEEKGPYH